MCFDGHGISEALNLFLGWSPITVMLSLMKRRHHLNAAQHSWLLWLFFQEVNNFEAEEPEKRRARETSYCGYAISPTDEVAAAPYVPPLEIDRIIRFIKSHEVIRHIFEPRVVFQNHRNVVFCMSCF
jgi:hypothetical protein